jgi:uncharacterized protein (DUF1501 family)
MAQTAADRRRAAKKAAATRKRNAAKKATPQVNRSRTKAPSSDQNDEAQVETTTEETEGVQEYEPRRAPLQHQGFDHHAAEEERQAELAEERKVHNERTGNPYLPEGFKY